MQANAALAENGKRLKQAETGNSDLQRRVDELDKELYTANSENRRFQDDLAQLRKSNDDLQAKFDMLTRENNKLTGTEHNIDILSVKREPLSDLLFFIYRMLIFSDYGVFPWFLKFVASVSALLDGE